MVRRHVGILLPAIVDVKVDLMSNPGVPQLTIGELARLAGKRPSLIRY